VHRSQTGVSSANWVSPAARRPLRVPSPDRLPRAARLHDQSSARGQTIALAERLIDRDLTAPRTGRGTACRRSTSESPPSDGGAGERSGGVSARFLWRRLSTAAVLRACRHPLGAGRGGCLQTQHHPMDIIVRPPLTAVRRAGGLGLPRSRCPGPARTATGGCRRPAARRRASSLHRPRRGSRCRRLGT